MLKNEFDLIKSICSRNVSEDFIRKLVLALRKWLPRYEMDRKLRACAFLAQCAHESGGFFYLKEIGGKSYFEKYEPDTKIGKMLGNTQIGDGYTYKGRGPIQISGRYNYKIYGDLIGLNLIDNPDLLLDISNGIHAACEFWKKNNLNHLADCSDIITMTKKINGGLNGLKERETYYAKLMREWNNDEEI